MDRRKIRWFALRAIVFLCFLTALATNNIASALDEDVSDEELGQISEQLTPEQTTIIQAMPAEQKKAAIKQYLKSSAPAPKLNKSPFDEKPQLKKTSNVATPDDVKATSGDSLDLNAKQADKKEKKVDHKLKQFGYDLFNEKSEGFAPATDIPVPYDYIVGPGDFVRVQLYGRDNADYNLLVSREGMLNFPGIGPVPVAGLKFEAMVNSLNERIEKQMIGVKSNISMGALRSIRVFVLGDVRKPGSYTVSSLSTMTNALFSSGGITSIGSLRKIELKRSGRVVTRLDLYDLLLEGDTRKDARLQPGDVIFVPPIGDTAGIVGEVKRPAIYEINGEKTVADLLQLSGGLMPTAYPRGTQLERINIKQERELLDVDLTRDAGLTLPLCNGDSFRVYSILEKMDNVVLLSGNVHRPGGYQWHEGMRLTDVIRTVDDLLPSTDMNYVLIRRELMPERRIVAISTMIGEVFNNPASSWNVALMPRDQITVFGLSDSRQSIIRPLIDNMRKQAVFNRPEPVVSIEGNVRQPGSYPLETGMRLSGLVRAAMDLLPETDLEYALVVRERDNGETVTPLSVSLKDTLKSPDGTADIALEPRDSVYVFSGADRQKMISQVMERIRKQAKMAEPVKIVSITGFVRAGGDYPLENGMTVSGLIRAAGGLTEGAYGLSAELTRQSISGKGEFRETDHITIDLQALLAGDAKADIALVPHDVLSIKNVPLWDVQRIVEIRGEVRFPGKYPISRGESMLSIIKRAGGLTDMAYPAGAVFMREELRAKEQEQIDILSSRLEADLAASAVEKQQGVTDKSNLQEASALTQSLVNQLRKTKAIGRLVIDLPAILSGDGGDVILRGGDKLVIPVRPQEVSVIGEVHYPTSHLYDRAKTRDEYINMSGGITYKADSGRIYIVRADGTVVSGKGQGWFWNRTPVMVGDTIVVPLDADRIKPLTLLTNVSQILYQLGVAAAAWHAVGAF